MIRIIVREPINSKIVIVHRDTQQLTRHYLNGNLTQLTDMHANVSLTQFGTLNAIAISSDFQYVVLAENSNLQLLSGSAAICPLECNYCNDN